MGGQSRTLPSGEGREPRESERSHPSAPPLTQSITRGSAGRSRGAAQTRGNTKPEFFWRTAILGMGWVERTKNIQRTEAHAEGEMDMGTQEDGDTHGHKQRQTHVIRHTYGDWSRRRGRGGHAGKAGSVRPQNVAATGSERATEFQSLRAPTGLQAQTLPARPAHLPLSCPHLPRPLAWPTPRPLTSPGTEEEAGLREARRLAFSRWLQDRDRDHAPDWHVVGPRRGFPTPQEGERARSLPHTAAEWGRGTLYEAPLPGASRQAPVFTAPCPWLL